MKEEAGCKTADTFAGNAAINATVALDSVYTTFRYTTFPPRLTYLRGNDNIVPIPIEMLNRTTHDLFRLPLRITLSAVKEVDARVKSSFQARKGVFVADVATIREPASERNGRNLKTAFAHEAVLHFREVFGCFGCRHDGDGSLGKRVLRRDSQEKLDTNRETR